MTAPPPTGARPNLFIVGAPRCGTSALHSWLGAHPDVFMSRVKEPHFFSTDLNRERAARHATAWWPFTELAPYLWLFRGARRQRVVGESSVLYLYSREAAAGIAAFDPGAKIIAMVREPVEFARSVHAMLFYLGEEDCPSLLRAVELEDERRAGRRLPAAVRIPSVLFYTDMARFSEQIERYLARFPREQVKVLVLDDLRSEGERVCREVLAFAGVDSLAHPSRLLPRNQNRVARSRLIARFLRGGDPQAVRLYKDPQFPRPAGFRPRLGPRLLPAFAWSRLYRALQRLNSRHEPREPLDPSVQRALRTRFAPEVQRLSALLDRDLASLWGY